MKTLMNKNTAKMIRKKMVCSMIAVAAVMVTTLVAPMHSYASVGYIDLTYERPEVYDNDSRYILLSDGTVFDPEYYEWAHPELGANQILLAQHYLTIGKANGWLPTAPKYDIIPAPIPMQGYWAEKMLSAYSCLVNGEGICQDAKIVRAGEHEYFIDHGLNMLGGCIGSFASNPHVQEGVLFDPVYYAIMNPDVAALYGTDKDALWNHYKTVGVYEGRPAGAVTYEANAKIKAVQVAASIITPDMSDEQKVTAIHDWMIDNAEYDLENSKNNRNLRGFLLEGIGVCQGYSLTFDCFMSILDIPCEVVTGCGHAWNRVLINGQWLNVDVTYDDPVAFQGGFSMTYRWNGSMLDYANGPRMHMRTDNYLLRDDAYFISTGHIASQYYDFF